MTATNTPAEGAGAPNSQDVWTPFQEGDEPTMGFGRAELLYALLAEPTEIAMQTVVKLGYAEEEVVENTRLVGGSSLFAQGQLVTEDGETFLPVHEAALVGRAAATVTAWITLGAATDGAGEALLGLVAQDSLLLIAPGPLESFVVTLVPAGDQLLDVVGSMLSARLETTEAGGTPVFLNVEFVGEQSSTMFIRRHATESDAFEVAIGEGTTEKPPILPGAKTGDQVDEFIADMLGVDPDTGEPDEVPAE